MSTFLRTDQALGPGWDTPRESLPAVFDRHYLSLMSE